MKSSLIRTMLRVGVGIVVTLTFAGGSYAFAQDLESARKAANRGDFSTAAKMLEPLARAGDSEAQFILGRMYARGDGVRQDFRKAFTLFEAAAYAGHYDAAERLAMMYDRGDGVAKSKKQAQFWRRVAVGAEPPPQPPTPTPPPLPSAQQPEPAELTEVIVTPTILPPPTLPAGDSFAIPEPLPTVALEVATLSPIPEPTIDRHLRDLRSLPRPLREGGEHGAPPATPYPQRSKDGPSSWKELLW